MTIQNYKLLIGLSAYHLYLHLWGEG